MTTFKSLLAAVILTTGTVAMAPAVQADTISESRIAVVDIQAIMRDSTAAKSVREQLEAKQKAFQAEISKKEQALQKEDQELANKRSALSKEAFEEKVKEFRKKAADTQKEVAEKKAVLDRGFESSLSTIQTTVTDIISSLAKEKGFVVALPTSQILYADDALNISDEVLARLNKDLPKVNVKF